MTFDYLPSSVKWGEPAFMAIVDMGTGRPGEYFCQVCQTPDEDYIREWLGTGLRKLGARAMGAK